MESLQDQIDYGNHCVHGTAIGTPGGADLMCGWCEDGLDWWYESPRYGLFLSVNGLESGRLMEWSDPLDADDDYVARAWDQIGYWADLAKDAPGSELVVRRTRAGYWDEAPKDSASHAAAGHKLPVPGAEGYCLTCYRDLADIESWLQRVVRLAMERKRTILDIMDVGVTCDEWGEYVDELYFLNVMAHDIAHGAVEDLDEVQRQCAHELIEQEDSNIASWS